MKVITFIIGLNNFKELIFVVFLVSWCLTGCQISLSNEAIPIKEVWSELNHEERVRLLKDAERKDINWGVRTLYTMKDSSDIDDILDLVRNSNTANPALINLLSDYYVKADAFDKAESVLQMDESTDVKNPDRYALKTSTALGLGELALAIDLINEGLLLSYDDPDLYEKKGDIYMALEDLDAAKAQYFKSYQLDTNQSNVAVKLAQTLVNTSQYSEAEKILNNTKWTEEDASAVNSLALIYVQQGKVDKAKEMWRTLLGAGDLSAGYRLLNVSQEGLSYDSVMHYANEIIRIDSLNQQALLAKARVFDMRGYSNSAIAYYQQVLAQDSTHEDARLGLEKVNRKIAYLRRIRAQQAATPRLELTAPRKNTIDTNE